MKSAASSSAVPPISPIMMMLWVSGSASSISSTSICSVPFTGSPPMPTQVVWPRPTAVVCAHRFIGQRAGARDDAHRAAAMDMARHDADLAFARRDHARAVGADQPRLGAAQRALHLHHVEHRNAFGDADDQRHFRVDRFQDGVGGEGRRHIDRGSVGADLLLGFAHGVEHRQAQMGLAAFARRGAAHHLGAVGDGLFGMEGALAAGEALADDFGVLVDENGHYLEPFTALTTFSAASARSLRGDDGEAGLGEDFLAQFDIGAFQPHHQRHLQRNFLRRGDDAFGDDVAFHDAAEDVDQDALHIGIADDDLEGRGDLFLRSRRRRHPGSWRARCHRA